MVWKGKNYHPLCQISFAELLEKHRAVNAGKSPKTKGNIEWAINTLRRSWKRGFHRSSPLFAAVVAQNSGIVRLLRSGVNVKLVSKWQGHQDGGKLILDTYSDIISDSDKAFERQELEKPVA